MQQATQLAGESIPGFVHSLLPVELFYAILPDQLVYLACNQMYDHRLPRVLVAMLCYAMLCYATAAL